MEPAAIIPPTAEIGLAEGLLATAAMALVLAFYLLPAIIGFARKHHNRAAILALNLFLGWLLIGWVGALIWAFTAVDRRLEPPGPRDYRA